MKKTLITFFFLCITFIGFAQSVEEEFPFDDESYNLQEEILSYGSPAGNNPSNVRSIKNFCPSPSNLPRSPAGMSLSIAIAHAMTIQFGQRNNWSKDVLNKERFSDYFLWDMLNKTQTTEGCKLQKDYVGQIKRVLEKIGNLKARDYAETKPCGMKPNLSNINPLKKYSVKEFSKLIPDRKASVGTKKYAIQRSLKDRQHPVILVMSFDESFRNLKGSTVWMPSNSATLFNHTVLVVGYDDDKQLLEIFNPAWGSQWGNGGFASIRYQDLIYANYAWELMIDTEEDVEIVVKSKTIKTKVTTIEKEETTSVTIPKKKVSEHAQKPKESLKYNTVGEFKLKIPVFGAVDNYTFQEVSVSRKGSVFEPNQPWQVNKQFQLVSNGTEGKYIYVFSIDPKGKAEIHFPQNISLNNLGADSKPISPIIADKNTQVVIPQPTISYDENGTQKITENALTQVHEGTDWVVVLYSDKRIDEQLPTMVKTLANHQQDLVAKFKDIFGEILVEDSKIRFQGGSMKFEAKTDEKRFIIPIILKTITK
jgi:hypothetical protein